MKKTTFIQASIIGTLLFSSCLDKKELYDPGYDKPDIEASFDFKTTVKCPIKVSIDYKTLVSIYADDPDKSENPHKIHAAYTNYEGSYEGTMEIPAEYLGKTLYATTFEYKMTATASVGGVRFSASRGNSSATTNRSVKPSSNETTEGMSRRLRDEYIMKLRENTNNTEIAGHNENLNLHITTPTNLTVSFIFSGANHGSKLYYYYYKTAEGSQNAMAEKPYEAPYDSYYQEFGNSKFQLFADKGTKGEVWKGWSDFSNEHYCVGAAQDLLFYGEKKDQAGTTVFPEGYSIGFFIKGPKEFRPIYTESQYNRWNNQGTSQEETNQVQVGRFKDTESKSIIYGFEDLPLSLDNPKEGDKNRLPEISYNATDKDYNDIIFAVMADPFQNLEEDIPELTDPEEGQKVSTEGTLLYEDNYPEQGDYDMNDVIIEYKWTKYFNSKNQMLKIKGEFTPVHDGAKYISDFYVMVNWDHGGLRVDPTLAFSDHKASLGKKFTITLTHQIKDQDINSLQWENINPYIHVRETGREVHLSKKAASPKANMEGLDEWQKRYASETGYPYAMDIPITGFKPVTERVRIDEEYVKYPNWVESGGKEDTDWYK